MRFAKFTLFPDGYRLQLVPGLPGFHFPCPVRTCPRQFKKLEHLEQHFEVISPVPDFGVVLNTNSNAVWSQTK